VANELIVHFASALEGSTDSVRSFFLPAMEIVSKTFNVIGKALGGVSAALVQLFSGNFKRAYEIAKATVKDSASGQKELLEVIMNPSAAAEKRSAERMATAIADNAKRAAAAAAANLGNIESPLASVFENDLLTINKVIGGIRQAITSRKELNREEGSGTTIDTRFQSLRPGALGADRETLRSLEQIEANLQGKELTKLMREVRDILARQSNAQVAVFG
jgi:hypothetical protein